MKIPLRTSVWVSLMLHSPGQTLLKHTLPGFQPFVPFPIYSLYSPGHIFYKTLAWERWGRGKTVTRQPKAAGRVLEVEGQIFQSLSQSYRISKKRGSHSPASKMGYLAWAHTQLPHSRVQATSRPSSWATLLFPPLTLLSELCITVIGLNI